MGSCAPKKKIEIWVVDKKNRDMRCVTNNISN